MFTHETVATEHKPSAVRDLLATRRPWHARSD
jgi:hypothetical protein